MPVIEDEPIKAKILASTGLEFCCSVNEYRSRQEDLKGLPSDVENSARLGPNDIEGEDTNYFKSMQWSPDGTCLLTNSADNIIKTFIIPPDLLSSRPNALPLAPYSSLVSPEPLHALTPYPFFNLSAPSTALLLWSPRDLPIRLSSALYPSTSATYPLISPTTEAYLTPSSLLWTSDGTKFFSGSDSLIALFDVSRNGQGPMTRLPTIPSRRHNMKGGGVGMRGIVSCLSLQPSSSPTEVMTSGSSLLAAGTWTRWVSLYDTGGLGGAVANWSVASAADQTAQISGAGVSQLLWSPCGSYLFVIERKSRGVLVYDVRFTGKLVAWLEGRKSEVNQRLGVDIFSGDNDRAELEMWAGGVDGTVRLWKWRGRGPVGGEEALSPVLGWKAHRKAVTSVAVHPSGTVVATSSGQRQEKDYSSKDGDDETESGNDHISEPPGSLKSGSNVVQDEPDNSIKIWSL